MSRPRSGLAEVANVNGISLGEGSLSWVGDGCTQGESRRNHWNNGYGPIISTLFFLVHHGQISKQIDALDVHTTNKVDVVTRAYLSLREYKASEKAGDSFLNKCCSFDKLGIKSCTNINLE